MRKGAVKTKKQKNNRIVMFLLTFLLLLSIPFTALAAGNGYHLSLIHILWACAGATASCESRKK